MVTATNSPRQQLGENLRRLRGAIRQEVLADETGLRQATISDIERGVGNPTVETLAKIASKLGVKVSDLVAGI